MSDHSPSKACPKCGAALPSAATSGLCPRCLMAEAMLPTQADTAPASGAKILTPEQLAPHFPQLEILECLGRGGMGVVYKARQKSLGRLVALKLLAPERAQDAGFAERFAREAQALAALNHPHIVTVHDFGVVDAVAQRNGDAAENAPVPHAKMFFLLMEFVDGVNLRQAMKAGRFTPEQALAVVPPVCEALQYAHEHGIVHRDIKPENLLLDKEGRVKIADFGIAKMLGSDADTAARDEGPQAGTPQYMAPEQKAHRATDHRADIYSLGVVLYELLTGELPADKLQPPSRKVQIDVRLDEIVLRALEKSPELRYQTAGEFRTQLVTMTSENQKPQASAATVPPISQGYEYKSKRMWFGLPLLHVANGVDPQTGKVKRARGIVAIGGVATGWLAFGARAYGGIAFGALAVGGLAFGGAAVGLVAFGGLALALLMAIGGLAQAPIAVDGRPANMQHWAGHFAHGANPGWLTGIELNRCIWALWIVFTVLWGASYLLSSWAKKQSLHGSPTSGEPKPSAIVESRFSRTAIWGACWAAFSIFAALFLLQLQSPFLGVPPASIAALAKLIIVLLLIPGFTAPFGATILGWVAVMQIRRSAGKLHGLGLAVFNGLFFPLLALGVVIGAVWYMTIALAQRSLHSVLFETWDNRSFDHLLVSIWVLLTFATLAWLGFLIIRAVWRAVHRPVDGDPADGRSQPLGRKADAGFGRWLRKFFLVQAPIAIVVALVVRTFVAQPFTAATDAASPEIPRGSHVLVWKLTRTFAAGDLIAYMRDGRVNLGRIAGKVGDAIVVNRTGEGPSQIPLATIIGKVVSIYWRATLGPDASRLESPYTGTTTIAWANSAPKFAANETWSPTLAPGAKPDLQQILSEAQALTAGGKYEESLQRHLWFHRHALEFDPGMSAVRLSFALSYWTELARRYPKAKQALIEIRDHDASEVRAGRGYFDLFMEVESINGCLQDEAATLALFKVIEREDPQLANQCAPLMDATTKQHSGQEKPATTDAAPRAATADPLPAIELKVAQRQLEKVLGDLQAVQTERALLPSKPGMSDAEQKGEVMQLERKLRVLEEQAAQLRARIQQSAKP
jgi:predicted Ser/Thr protein kinase